MDISDSQSAHCQGIEHLSRYFAVDFRILARDTCFLVSSVGTRKKHKPTPHVYPSNNLGDLRVGWIYNEAYSLALSKNYRESLARFDEVLRLEPSYFHAWNQKGLCYYFLGRYALAIKCFDKANTMCSNYVEPHINKGCVLQRLDKFDSAIECFDDAESIQQGLFEALNNKAISLIALGDFTGALTCLDRCVLMGAIKPSVHTLRSLCFLVLEQISEGLLDLEIALQLDPLNKHASTLRKAFDDSITA